MMSIYSFCCSHIARKVSIAMHLKSMASERPKLGWTSLQWGKGSIMKQVLLFVALMLASVLASAQVFKCNTQNGMVYSEQPCGKDATAVNNLAKEPSEEDVKAAQLRQANDNIDDKEYQKKALEERQAQEARQSTRVVGVIVITRPGTIITTTNQVVSSNQNSQVRPPPTVVRPAGNHAQAK